MKEPTISTNNPSSSDTSTDTEIKPQGIGMAVAFDWGLAVQTLVTPVMPLIFGVPGAFKQFSPPIAALLTSLISLPIAALFAAFGESIRRGWRLARPIQMVANALLFLAGIASLMPLWNGIKQGNYWPTVTTSILLLTSPIIVWRMNSAGTKAWFATVTSAEAQKRHGGAWPFLIALWAIVGGILQAIAVVKR